MSSTPHSAPTMHTLSKSIHRRCMQRLPSQPSCQRRRKDWLRHMCCMGTRMARHSRSLAHKDQITRSNASYLAKITSQPHPTGGMRHWPHQGSNHRRNRILRHPLVLAMPPHWLALRQPQQSALGRTVPAKSCADYGVAHTEDSMRGIAWRRASTPAAAIN